MGGVSAQVFAQAPSLSLPALSSIGGAAPSNAPAIGALPPINLPTLAPPSNPVSPQVASPLNPSASAAVPASPTSPLPTLPPLPGSPEALKAERDSAPKGSPTPIVLKSAERSGLAPDATTQPAALGGMPPLPSISAPAVVAEAPEPADAMPALPAIGGAPAVATLPDIEVDASTPQAPALPLPAGIPALPLPGEEGLPAAPMSDAQALAVLGAPELDAPLVKVVREKVPPKTWETTLAPAIIPTKTNFNYKRALLPNAIYRTDYNKNNRHLPRRVTRDDYARLLFSSVTKNDLTTTRALLNAGVSLKATNMNGETPLQLARRMGAEQVAQLLIARGAVN